MADHDQITDDCEPGIVLVRETDHGRFQQEVSSPNVIVGEGLGCGIYKGVSHNVLIFQMYFGNGAGWDSNPRPPLYKSESSAKSGR